jgi:hypothetical protein
MVKSNLLQQFHRADGRAEFERVRRDLKNGTLDETAGERIIELGAVLDAGVARIKRELLGSALCWNEDSQQQGQWIYQQHRGVVELALRVVEPMRRHGHPLLQRLTALTLYHWGESLKWSMARERHEYEPLHDLVLLGMVGDRHREPLSWLADGRGHNTTIEALYFRMLLLDRFTSGSLTRQQVEILDSWLWEWAPVLRGERTPPKGAALRVDLDSNCGLREGRRDGEGASLYLALEPLEAQRRNLIAEFHAGRLVPAHGCAAEFRIEEHICVLDHLARAFRAAEGEAPLRAPRQQANGVRMEVWVGLPEILSRGMGIGAETGRYRALNLADPSIVQNGNATRFGDASRRYLWLVDASASGLGFEALESDAAGIEVGDLLGWRKASGAPIQLGRVTRRMPSSASGQIFIGVQLLTHAAQPLKLSQVVTFDNGQADGTYLFVPGTDESGRHDAFLVSENTYELQSSYRAHVGNDSFMLKFNRVRRKGRGWILAGFEILPSHRPDAESSIPRELDFTLVLDPPETTLDNPWQNEVREKLLS